MEKGIKEFIRLLEAEKDFIFQDSTKRVSNALVRISPVDEGEYVADWDVAVGHWPADLEHQNDPKKAKTRKRLQIGFKDVEYGNSVFFENNDEVAARLEFGYSKQAPQGVVRLTARKWPGFVRGAARAAQNKIRKKIISE